MRAVKSTVRWVGIVITALGVMAMLAMFAYAGATGDFHPFGLDSPNLIVLAVAWFGLILCVIGDQ
jgi:hypothetical protein